MTTTTKQFWQLWYTNNTMINFCKSKVVNLETEEKQQMGNKLYVRERPLGRGYFVR